MKNEEQSDLQVNDGDEIDADLPLNFEDIQDVVLEEGKSQYCVINIELHTDILGRKLPKIKKKQIIRGYEKNLLYSFIMNKFEREEMLNFQLTHWNIVIGG